MRQNNARPQPPIKSKSMQLSSKSGMVPSCAESDRWAEDMTFAHFAWVMTGAVTPAAYPGKIGREHLLKPSSHRIGDGLHKLFLVFR